MKAFILKALNLGLICAVLYSYQGYAAERARQIEEYEQEKADAKKAWEEAEREQATAQAKPADAQKAGKTADQEQEEISGFPLEDGIYEGSGEGFGGRIRVQLTIQGGEILSAKILSAENETPDYLKAAQKILDEVVVRQTAEVDTVAGATLSSNGILEGIRNALEDSNGNEK